VGRNYENQNDADQYGAQEGTEIETESKCFVRNIIARRPDNNRQPAGIRIGKTSVI